MKPLVIYHGGCTDGVAAAWACHYWLTLQGGQDLEYAYGIYNKPLPPVEGREVYVVDFSYKMEEMADLVVLASKVHWMDHHASAQPVWDCLRILYGEDKLSGIFDQGACGALLTWRYLAAMAGAPEKKPPELMRYIDDRDRWVKALPDGDEVIMALRSRPHNVCPATLELWGQLMGPAGVASLRTDGAAILRYYEQRVEDILQTADVARIADHMVPVANCPFAFASDVAGRLAENDPDAKFAACYWITGASTSFSLRSRGGFDVSKIAEQYGGGGHRGASGFRIPTAGLVAMLGSWDGLAGA